jgi:hypothetical protein
MEQVVQKPDRDLALEHLAKSRERLLGAVNGLSGVQWSFRPEEGRWSVADCVEHITVVENNLLRTMHLVLQTPPEPSKAAEVQGKDQTILEAVPSRGRRVQGPAEVMPRGRWPNTEELVRQFEEARDRTVRFTTATQAPLRQHFFPHPFLGTLDCCQWLLFIGTHCERHVRQMEEVKAHPGFPVKAGSASAI